jgi:DNA invertase Pin-like site-specific DNA recombinase
MIRERVLTGIARAREQGTQLGRRRLEDTDSKKVRRSVTPEEIGLASGALRGISASVLAPCSG